MKKNNDEYIYDDFVFKKLTSNNLGEVNPEDICIYATAFPGAMGWGGATQIITKDNNRYMSTLESLDDEKDIEKAKMSGDNSAVMELEGKLRKLYQIKYEIEQTALQLKNYYKK